MELIIGLIAVVSFIVALINGVGVVPGCIGGLVIGAISYIPIYLIITYWKGIGVLLAIIIGILALVSIYVGKKDKKYRAHIKFYEDEIAKGENKKIAYKKMIQALKDNKIGYSKEALEKQIEDINNKYLTPEEIQKKAQEQAELDRRLALASMRDYLSPRERKLVDRLQNKKDLTLDSLIKSYRSIRNIKDGEPFNEYEETTVENMTFMLSMNKNKKEIQSAMRRIIKKELENQKKELDKRLGFLEKKGAFIYIEKFIITVTMKIDMGEMKRETYNEKLQDLIRLLEYKLDLILRLQELKDMIQQLKDKTYKKYFIDKINYNESKSIDEVVHDYITVLGNQSDKSFYTGQLSELINLNEVQTKQKINKVKDKIRIQYETLRFEQELFQQDLAVGLEEIDELNGYEFEDYLVELFSNLGYDVLPTSYSGDQGADLIIQDSGRKIVIQAKNYSGNVGNKAIQEALAAKHHYSCDTAMVITNAYFTKQAQELAETTEVILIDREKLKEIIEKGKVAFLKYL